jgi:hypothetical protein
MAASLFIQERLKAKNRLITPSQAHEFIENP